MTYELANMIYVCDETEFDILTPNGYRQRYFRLSVHYIIKLSSNNNIRRNLFSPSSCQRNDKNYNISLRADKLEIKYARVLRVKIII